MLLERESQDGETPVLAHFSQPNQEEEQGMALVDHGLWKRMVGSWQIIRWESQSEGREIKRKDEVMLYCTCSVFQIQP